MISTSSYYDQRHPLDAIFAPKNVAVIGATEKLGSVGRNLLWNLISNPFGGTVFPVNPKQPSILGIKTYPTVADIPALVDLAIIVTPAAEVPAFIGQCAEANVKGAIIISSGFKECGPAGIELEQQVLVRARQMRVLGPNCLGIMNPVTGLNATFAGNMARLGNVAFISQSGALGTAVLDWSLCENVGFSNFISIGSMLDVGWGDLIDYLGNDPHTKSIVIYMETIGDARAFLSAAREVALTKPIIVLKSGHTQAAARAAASHTGSLTGSDEALDAAFRRCGVLRVNNISELFYMAEVLANQPRPRGPRLTILTNAGGPGVIATDVLTSGGGELTPLSEETVSGLNKLLPAHWSHMNPVDIVSDAGPQRYSKALEIAANDPNSDGLLVILAPLAMTNPTQTAEHLKQYAKTYDKPILASWMGGAEVAEGKAILNNANIPTFPYPDTAVQIFNHMWHYNYNLNSLYETPALSTWEDEDTSGRVQAERLVEAARQAGRTTLTEFESKEILKAYGIPTVETRVATSEEEAIKLAEEIGYPVVLKLLSQTITHKSEVGGVRLNLRDEKAVRYAYKLIKESVSAEFGPAHFLGVTVQPMLKLKGYELIVGSCIDPQLGPVLLFGSGGELVEVYKDRALGLPPLNTTLARRMIERTNVFQALKGARGRPAVDLAALDQIVVRFSQLVVEQRWIKEIEINPLVISNEGLVALDARVIIHEPEITEETLPKLAIRPYPIQYISHWELQEKDELEQLTIRPIRPEDEPAMAKFHQTLSDRSVYFRYFHMIGLSQRIEHERLTRICFIDYDRTMVLVADYKNPQTGQHEILGVGRLTRVRDTGEGDFAILVSDRCQGHGLGSVLLQRLVEIGEEEKMSRIVGDILLDNRDMQRVCKKLGFRIRYSQEEGVMKARKDLELKEIK
ncbi:MAG: bifunctional acetate--CoA ligase family protein/GNAT family N-acetyltransferase [Chloroflexi bacterium]|nr:bifunctional acetate--CoA ligase family protein/GNAT family N-acetyltransferase [Chloroflexota bacterium]